MSIEVLVSMLIGYHSDASNPHTKLVDYLGNWNFRDHGSSNLVYQKIGGKL